MSLADRDRKPWRLALLLLLGAYVGVVGYLVLDNGGGDELRTAPMRVARAPSLSEETHVPARGTVGAAAPIFTINAAVQRPGPPDPRAEQSAAESAEKAAEAAAAVAATAGSGTN
jgi:hypothetical protein